MKLFLAVAAGLYGPAALAAAIGVSPVMLHLAPGERAAPVTVSNDSEASVVVQVEPRRWRQVDGTDLYEEDARVVATPPLFRLPPGGQQVVRIGFPAGAPAGGEGAWRVYFSEVPPQAGPVAGGVQWVLRLGVPMFVTPPDAVRRDASWTARPSGGDSIQLGVRNTGDVHLRVTRIRLLGAGDTLLADWNALLYVLPGAWRSIEIPVSRQVDSGMPLTAVADTAQGPLRIPLVVGSE